MTWLSWIIFEASWCPLCCIKISTYTPSHTITKQKRLRMGNITLWMRWTLQKEWSISSLRNLAISYILDWIHQRELWKPQFISSFAQWNCWMVGSVPTSLNWGINNWQQFSYPSTMTTSSRKQSPFGYMSAALFTPKGWYSAILFLVRTRIVKIPAGLWVV